MKPHIAFSVMRPDEVAESMSVSRALYKKLWSLEPDYKGPAPHWGEYGPVGMDPGSNALSGFWDRFSDAEKAELNEVAEKEDEERGW